MSPEPIIRLRDFPPVEHDLDLDGSVSQTMLKHHDRCDRAAYLYALYGGGAGSHPLHRGTLFHLFAERATNELIEAGENTMPPEVAKDLMLDVMRERHDLVVPAQERDALRMMASHWAEGTWIEPANVLAVEQLFEIELVGWRVRMKIDRVEIDEFGTCHVLDYKTSWAKADREDFVPGDRGDGAERYSGDFQTQLYALGVAEGLFEGIRVGADIQRFHLGLVYPRWLSEDGELLTVDAYVDRGQLTDFRLDVELQLARLEDSLSSRKWEAVPGTHCNECPAPADCPIPRTHRPDSQLADATPEQAQKLAEWWARASKEIPKVKARLKRWADANGGFVVCGRDEILAFEETSREEIRDKGELRFDVEAVTKYGGDFDYEKHVRRSRGTGFKRRKMTPAEREEINANGNR